MRVQGSSRSELAADHDHELCSWVLTGPCPRHCASSTRATDRHITGTRHRAGTYFAIAIEDPMEDAARGEECAITLLSLEAGESHSSPEAGCPWPEKVLLRQPLWPLGKRHPFLTSVVIHISAPIINVEGVVGQ